MGSLTGQILDLQLVSALLALGIIGLSGLTLIGFFSRRSYLFDICGHFRMQYLILATGFALASLWINEWLLALISLAIASVNIIVLLPIYIRPVGWKRGQPEIRLLLANVLRKNQSYDLVLNLIRVYRPDVIVLIEPDQPWLDAMLPVNELFPYHHAAAQDDNYGLALLSRYPLENRAVHNITGKGVPTLSAEIRLDGQSVRILVTHPPPPKNYVNLSWRDSQMEGLAELAKNQDMPVILCGDFNITPWSRPFRRMEREGKLVDSTRGFGFQPTWPVDRPWLRVPIDHCLVSPNIQVVQRKVGPRIGSDHLPLIVDIRLS